MIQARKNSFLLQRIQFVAAQLACINTHRMDP